MNKCDHLPRIHPQFNDVRPCTCTTTYCPIMVLLIANHGVVWQCHNTYCMYGVGDLYSIIGRRDGEVYSNTVIARCLRRSGLFYYVYVFGLDGRMGGVLWMMMASLRGHDGSRD